MRRPMLSQVDQFCSTQLAALVALSWASWSDGAVEFLGGIGGRQDGQEHGRYLQA